MLIYCRRQSVKRAVARLIARYVRSVSCVCCLLLICDITRSTAAETRLPPSLLQT